MDARLQARWAARGCLLAIWAWLTGLCVVEYGFEWGATLPLNVFLAAPLSFAAGFCLIRSGTLPIPLAGLIHLLWSGLLFGVLGVGAMKGQARPFWLASIVATLALFPVVFRVWAQRESFISLRTVALWQERFLLWGLFPFLAHSLSTAYLGPMPEVRKAGFMMFGVYLADIPIWQGVVLTVLTLVLGAASMCCMFYPLVAFSRFRAAWQALARTQTAADGGSP